MIECSPSWFQRIGLPVTRKAKAAPHHVRPVHHVAGVARRIGYRRAARLAWHVKLSCTMAAVGAAGIAAPLGFVASKPMAQFVDPHATSYGLALIPAEAVKPAPAVLFTPGQPIGPDMAIPTMPAPVERVGMHLYAFGPTAPQPAPVKVPEPSSLALYGIDLGVIGFLLWLMPSDRNPR